MSRRICGRYVRMRAMSKKSRGFDKESFFRALADRTRLRLLNLMGTEEVCVCFFVEVLKTNNLRSAATPRTCDAAGLSACVVKVSGCTTGLSSRPMPALPAY